MLVGIIENYEYTIDEYNVKNITSCKGINGELLIKVSYKYGLAECFDKLIIK